MIELFSLSPKCDVWKLHDIIYIHGCETPLDTCKEGK